MCRDFERRREEETKRLNMNKEIASLLLVLAAFALSGCSKSSDGKLAPAGNNNQRLASQTPLAGVAEVVLRDGDLIPANVDMVRLMKLPTAGQDDGYYCRQIVLKPQPDDVRGIYVGVKDNETIILGRIDQRRDAFERYSYLTSPRGELRCIVYTSSGSREQRILANGDSGYEKAIKDFENQVAFWFGKEQELKTNHSH